MPRPRKDDLDVIVRPGEPRRDTRPPDFYATIRSLKLRVIRHGREAVTCNDGIPRFLPLDMIGTDGKTVIIYRRKDGDYDFPGWEPWHDGMNGGRYRRVTEALHWVQLAHDVRAGRRADFRGVR